MGTNAEKQAKAGFNAKVVRRTELNCCSWCASLAGTYTPEEAKAKGIYARHEGCVCTIRAKAKGREFPTI